MAHPILELNIYRASVQTGKEAASTWNLVQNELKALKENQNVEDRFLDVYSTIKALSGQQWKYSEDQALAFQALHSGKCNCSCGVQLLLCVAEWKGLLGEIGEAKWKDHTTLAHKRENGDIFILETTNRSPYWKSLAEVRRCHFRTLFDPKLIFLSSLGELSRKIPNRSEIIRACFAHFQHDFWLQSGGELAWICWKWINKSQNWKFAAWPLVEMALQTSQKLIGVITEKRLLIILFVACPISSPLKQQMLKRISQVNLELKTVCP
jgi:hypothetical protein